MGWMDGWMDCLCLSIHFIRSFLSFHSIKICGFALQHSSRPPAFSLATGRHRRLHLHSVLLHLSFVVPNVSWDDKLLAVAINARNAKTSGWLAHFKCVAPSKKDKQGIGNSAKKTNGRKETEKGETRRTRRRRKRCQHWIASEQRAKPNLMQQQSTRFTHQRASQSAIQQWPMLSSVVISRIPPPHPFIHCFCLPPSSSLFLSFLVCLPLCVLL